MIHAHRIGLERDGRWLWRGLDLHIDHGVTAIVGPSGAGKTTLLRCLLGLISPSQGEVRYSAEYRWSVQFPEDRLLQHLSVRENLWLVGISDDRAQRLAEHVGLAHALEMTPDSLSTGMARRASMIRALGYDGDVVFLDEPFKGIDAAHRGDIAQVLLQDERPIVIIDHDVELLESLATNMVRLGE